MAVIQRPKGKGRWYVYTTVYNRKTGQSKKVYLKGESFRTKALARDRDAQWRLERKAKRLEVGDVPLFGAVADSWLTIHGGKVCANTRRRYTITVEQLKKEFGDLPIDKITAKDIETYLAEFSAEGSRQRAPRTVNKNLEKLRAIFELAIEWGYINRSPVAKIRAYKARKAAIEVLTPEQALGLAEAASERARPIILTAYYTGMRIGEVLSLRWEQIDFKNGVIKTGSKTDAGIRTVPMMGMLAGILEAEKSGAEYVFANGKGKPHLYSNFRRREWLPALERAGLPPIGVHSLRHSFVSYLISLGLDIKTIQELVGHASPVTTMREYAHLFEGAKRSAIERMESDLREVGRKMVEKAEKKPPLTLVK